MATLHILSAGAAQAVVQTMMGEFQAATGNTVKAEFGAVGAMKARLGAFPADLIVLTAAMIDEMAAAGQVVAGSRADLGKVGTGVAVRDGAALPDISNAAALRKSLLAAQAIAFPDPATATAGKIVMQMFDKLGVTAEISGRFRHFPNGNAAMTWLASSAGSGELGITQATEIIPHKGVKYVGPLPEEFQSKAVYSAGIVSGAANAALARDFIGRLTSPAFRPALAAAGYEV